MRRGGLRGRALRQTGFKGLEGSALRSAKGKRGYEKRGSSSLAAIPESSDPINVLEKEVDVSEGGALVGVEAVRVEDRQVDMCVSHPPKGSVEGCEAHMEVLPAGELSDLALDMISAQPLQDMAFVGVQTPLLLEGEGSGKDSCMEDLVQEVGGEGSPLGSAEDFPPLSFGGGKAANAEAKNKEGGDRQP